MNVYAVVEGVIGEKLVYQNWIPLVNPTLTPVWRIDRVQENNVFVVSGGGFPNYFEVIENGVEDVMATEMFDRFVVGIDSEGVDVIDKYKEVEQFILNHSFTKEYRIIVQHVCLETWALGNRAISPRRPQTERLRKYRRIHDVGVEDPELLPNLPEEELNRAQFAEKYLRLLLNERFRNLSYTKGNPRPLLHPKYFERVRSRLRDTGHIGSFKGFLDAFV